jgi:nitrile hydratase
MREAHEPTFHAEWERRVFALTMAAGRPGKWNIDMGRFARENRPPADYLNKTYFEIWLARDAACRARLGVSGRDRGRPSLGRAKKC